MNDARSRDARSRDARSSDALIGDERIDCAVIGAGAWGTAIAHRLASNGHAVALWAREADVIASVNAQQRNDRFLPGYQLASSIRATSEMADALHDARLVVYAAPSHVLRAVVSAGAALVPSSATIAVATKGIERESLSLMTEVVESELHRSGAVGFSGPSFAAEVAGGQPTAVVAASSSTEAAALMQRAMSAPSFRVYTSDDVIGVELGGALKNVMAVAAGIVDGLDLGFNARAALITRGLAEMSRLGVALGARGETFAGLAGLGDLVLTCTGALSRNRSVGMEIGRGKSLTEALAGKESVAEGVVTTQSALALARRTQIEMPIVEASHRILFEGAAPRQAIADLMARELRAERD